MSDTAHDTTALDDPSFSARIRSATMSAHRDAERSGFVHRLMRGQFPVGAVADLMVQHLAVYTALESTAAVLVDDPVAGPFLDPRLERREQLRADLAALASRGVEVPVEPLEATRTYIDSIEASVGTPERFVAHHYTRLMGDLSGGQLIRRSLERHYGDVLDGALSFYDFDRIDDVDAFKATYRTRLDDAPLGPARRAALVDEVNRAYRHNGAVFAALDARHPAP